MGPCNEESGFDMTRANLMFRTLVLRVFCLLFLGSGLLKADVTISSNVYGLPYQWQMRKTAFYDATQQELFFGSISPNANSTLLLSTITGLDAYNYTPAGLTVGGFINAEGFDTRSVWDMNLVNQGTTPTPWLLSIMANAAGAAPVSLMYACNVTPNAFASFSYSTFNNNSGVASIPFKVCMAERASGSVAAADKPVFVVAIANSASDTTFNATVGGACFRLFTIDPENNTFIEFSGSKLAASALGSFGELRDMWWDSALKRLYCAFTRTNETKVGIACLYLDESTPASPVLKLLNNAELLAAPASGSSLIPYVHKVRTFCANPSDTTNLQNKYLIINGGRDANAYNSLYALPLVNRNNPALVAQGAVDTKTNSSVSGTSGSGVSTHDNSWLDQRNDIAALTAGLGSSSIIAARTVGAGPLPVSPTTPVTDIQISGLTVYVSVADDSGAECIFASTAAVYHENADVTNSTITPGENSKLLYWTPWKKIVDSSFNSPIAAFGIIDSGSRKLVALRDNNSIVSRNETTFPSFTTVPQRSFSSVSTTGLDLADLTTMWRSRQLGVVDGALRRLYAGTSLVNAGADTLKIYASSTLGAPISDLPMTSSTLVSSLYNSPIWTMGMYGSSLLVVPHTERGNSPSTGGKHMYCFTEGHLVAENTDADIKDKATSPAASRIVNFVVAQKDVNTKFILAAIPQADQATFSSGHDNCVRSFTYTPPTSGLGSIVPAASDDTFTYNLGTGGAALAIQSGQTTGYVLTYRSLEDMYYDSVFNVVYLGFTRSVDGGAASDATDDPGLTFLGWNTAGTATRVSGKLLEGCVDDTTGFKHVLKVRTLHTRTGQTNAANNRSYLIMNATNYMGLAGDGTDQANVALNRIYALPLVVSGDDAGKIATSTTHATKAVLAANTWSETGASAENYAQHVVGGGYLPTHPRSVVTGMVTRGKAVFVSVANPQGVVGERGVFVSQAITDSDEKLTGWTAWKKIGGGNENIAFLGYHGKTDSILAVNHDSSRVEEFTWKPRTSVESAKLSYQNLVGLAKTLESDFPSQKRGMYNIQSLPVISTDNATTAHMVGAFGYDSLALAYLIKKTTGDVGTVKYPHKLETTRYKCFADDSVLAGIKSLYCLAVPTRAPGWVFAAGYRGLAVLRDASSGRGWTSLPASLSDASSGVAITSQTWKQIPEVVGPVYKMITMTTSSMTPLVICMTKKGLQAFVADEDKFKTTDPDPLALFDASSIFTDPTEYMRDIAPVGGKMFLVGTTKGLYLMQVNDTNDAFISSPTQILYGSALLGPIGTIRTTHPKLASVGSLNPTGLNNAWINVDVLTARVINDQSEHYQFKIKLNSSGVVDVGGITSLSLYRSFTKLEGKLFTSAGENSYILPGKHLSTGGSLDIFADDALSSEAPFTVLQNDSQIGAISEVAADGTRVVTAGGNVYVYKA